jgi:hypothetical protein
MTLYSVSRDSLDRLRVFQDGRQILDVGMGPGSPLHPESADVARTRPWFYTGSPYGKEIMDLAWQREALTFYKIQLLDQAATQVPHEFWEDSPKRIAMDAARAIMAKMNTPTFIFIGERFDGLWIWFTRRDDADQFKALRG